MPRIRTIKPDAFHSDSLSRVPREVRWTFAGLWTYCDDAGRARDDVRLIKAALYPLDDDVSLDVLADDLAKLEAVGCICRYTAGGRRLLHVPGWEHQKINRPTPSKLPPCADSHEDSGTDLEESVTTHGAITEDSLGERKGKEQGKEQGTRAARGAHAERFGDFWSVYPRRIDKGHAEKAWAKIGKTDTDPQVVIDAAARFAAKVKDSDPKFIPYPATWLNGERWADEDNAPTPPDNQWQERFVPPSPPPEIADDPAAYQNWLQEQRDQWNARRAGGGR